MDKYCKRCGRTHDFKIACSVARGSKYLEDACTNTVEEQMLGMLVSIRDSGQLSGTKMHEDINKLILEVIDERQKRR